MHLDKFFYLDFANAFAKFALFEKISKRIDEAHRHVKTTVNTAMVYTYYGIGKYIIEDEQQGEKRAAYGKAVLKNLSVRLTGKYGKGWSVATLKNSIAYIQKRQTVFVLLKAKRLNTV